MLKLTQEVKDNVILPLRKFQPLQQIIKDLQSEENDLVMIFSKLQYEIYKFKNHGYNHLHKCINIPKEQYNSFFFTIRKVEKYISSIPKEYKKGILQTTKKEIDYVFNYHYYTEFNITYKAKSYIFDIWEAGKSNENSFSFQLRVMENGTDLKIVDLFPDTEKYYLGKGISIAMILKAKSIFNKRIISSSNVKHSFSNEMRWSDATNKVWKKLEIENLAKYDKENDYYYTTN